MDGEALATSQDGEMDERYMRLALEKAESATATGASPSNVPKWLSDLRTSVLCPTFRFMQ